MTMIESKEKKFSICESESSNKIYLGYLELEAVLGKHSWHEHKFQT